MICTPSPIEIQTYEVDERTFGTPCIFGSKSVLFFTFLLFQSALQNATFENGSVAFILKVNTLVDCSYCNSEIVRKISLN